ncbi:hypothetical protein ACFY00_12725 [Kitasatospora sp. NPDC001540]|uniref:hypothetical protein n=1 Tax=Kitasatospora sp. NPDC001540 TaxID=3364014 RepID=UPI0036976556
MHQANEAARAQLRTPSNNHPLGVIRRIRVIGESDRFPDRADSFFLTNTAPQAAPGPPWKRREATAPRRE